ncbi:uncharacterized protein RAG0_04844 [Rhynchosporium agropyri]|uniref:Nudix hydrolase domain-containing protein n=1 Tax=Rhynchosporium agropyri TaxID=914238 RepID=A0A1E1KAD8_9HELO|nr:uncharacterized protein RAG0_04844 [Rhynchosporium agropyri]
MAQSTPTLQSFTFSPTLASFDVPKKTCLSSPSMGKYQAIATGALIFTPTSNKILVLQRAPTDSSPNKWENPGGGVDDTDATILHGVAREVLEETGLIVTHINRLVTVDGEEGFAFESSKGLRIIKFAFDVEVDSVDEVKLDKNEHRGFLWASEKECRERRMEDGYQIEFTGKWQYECILEGFRLRKEEK